MLFKALSGLARTGYPAPPDEGMDLIHDFYIHAWPGVSARYDASRASFDTYLFACFVRFARPRIARLMRLRETLMGPAEMEAAAQAARLVVAGSPDAPDIPAVRAALAALPADGRALLDAYLDDAAPSERLLAARFAMTRYGVRLKLAETLGLLAVRLGLADGLGEPDRAVALALWADQRSPRQAAALLGMSTDAVQTTKIRLFTRLVEAARGTRQMSNTFRAYTSAGQAALAGLVTAALAPDANRRDFDALRVQAESVCAFLDTAAGEAVVERIAAADDGRLADLYDALAGTSGTDDEPDFHGDALMRAHVEDARDVGHAFSVLLAGNPQAWRRFESRFEGVATVGADRRADLADDPSLGELPREARDALERHGLTPVILAEAMRSLSNTAMEFCMAHGIGRDGRFRLQAPRPEPKDDTVPVLERWAAEEELGLDLDLGRDTAEAVYGWLHDIAGELPRILDGFETQFTRGSLVLTRTDAFEPDLLRRWHAPQAAAIAC